MTRRRQRLPQEPIELDITDLSHDGRGIARHHDKVVFVQNALPGEKVTAKLNRRTRHFDEATAETIENHSPDRVDPLCEFYDRCNGCTMMHVSDDKQIEFKFNTLKSNLEKMAEVQPNTWLPHLSDRHWYYRRRARLSVKWVPGKDKVLVGFREKNGRFVADMDNCLVLEKPLANLIKPLQELVLKMSIKTHIPQVECALSEQQPALIMRHMRALSDDDVGLLKQFAKDHNIQLFLQSKGPDTVIPLQSDYQALSFMLPQENLRYEFLPNDFIQVNQAMNEKMIARVLSTMELNSDAKVLDLFCGLGNFTLPLARHSHQVTGVEGDQQLVERARHNATLNGLNNVEFFTADLTKDHSQSSWLQQDYSHVLIDPPRSGAWDILPLIAQSSADTLVYVSCHPASLARDSKRLVHEFGFNMQAAGVMDMFPHTSHVESMAVFKRH
ncbi:23S rRNA (uracil(1939)-C(5))-methyltransferase RlmD [Marinicella gelatinilytica]|uniref:23S rRNA (uracil(1939)-C(5))-methyltransferase RlmD n=1 Tax=Marinicella gelatinilytica TaxID=2996017 RepID=UPI002260EF9D|nr:23S rRNA (uracil(1939)-C(5))-methyltransferase RlmD [Marinicella gelatinilytica]MCX7544779.1 23S rRNA (uracil(1939)-C(5))-methyltransferase RlmD [Marinicella gelatinilytica]